MLLMLASALALGAATTFAVLWFTAFGNTGQAAAIRLSRLKSDDGGSGNPLASLLALRGRAKSINFGGINVVNANIVQKWTKDLERAGLTLNVREFFILRVAVALVLVALGVTLSPVLLLGLVGAPAGWWIVGFWLTRRVKKRRKQLDLQLVELLQMLASGLRAGFGLMQAMEAAAEQLTPPVSIELRRFMRDTAMGASVESAMQSMNDRIGSNDWDIVITAIMIQRTVGGNLAEILDNVANTMRERMRIKNEIQALTSQQRMTGMVIGFIPLGLGIMFAMINWEFMSLLFTDSLGRIMLMAGIVMWGIGFMVIRKIVDIEV
jgi:tight adherence protein B